MTDVVFSKEIHYGPNARDTQPLRMEMRDLRADAATGKVTYRVVLAGPLPVDKAASDLDAFCAIRMAMAGMRQMLRMLQLRSPGLKYFEDIEGQRVEQSVDELFWTQDCVPETKGR